MIETILSPWPSFSSEEIKAVNRVLESNHVNYWTGTEGREFEKEYAHWLDVDHAIALSNGTVALDLALKAVGVGGGDEVIVTPRTFIASVSSVVTAGATPVFADVELDSGNISSRTIAPLLTDRTKAIIPVHLGGWPADIPGILDLVQSREIAVIEDCAQAHGAMIDGRHVGSLGTIGAWSFCQDKIMTTGGEGGMVTTNNPDMWSAMWSYKDHGKSWDAVYQQQHAPGYRWLHESFGTNWRMMEMQAAIGRLQLQRMASWTSRRTHIAMELNAALQAFSSLIRAPMPPVGSKHAYYRYYTYVKQNGLKEGWSRDRIVSECCERGAPVYQGSCSEIYREKAFDDTPWRPIQPLSNAAELGNTSLMFLTHPTITDQQLDCYCKTVREVMETACK